MDIPEKKNNHLRNDTLFCTARFLHCSRSTAPRRVASCLLIDIRSSQDIQPALCSKSENSLKCFAPRPFFFFFLFFFQSDFIIESPLTSREQSRRQETPTTRQQNNTLKISGGNLWEKKASYQRADVPFARNLMR